MKSNNFKEYVNSVRPDIDSILREFYDKKILQAGFYDINYKRLLSRISAQALRGGKRMRPALAVLGYQLAGGKEIQKIYLPASALEIYHNFLLIHDDVMDRDNFRHGSLNISGLYKKNLQSKLGKTEALHIAQSFAILAGDISFGLCSELLLKSKFDYQKLILAQKKLNKATFEVAAGQQLDVISTYKNTLSISKILKIYTCKTADYSVTLPLQFGASFAEDSPDLQRNIKKFGDKVGVAFQLVDDVLGMYKNEKQLGKPVYSDLREGKQTILMHYGFLLSTAEQKNQLNKYFKNQKVGQKELLITRKILEQNGAKVKTLLIAQSLINDAKKIIPAITDNTKIQTILSDFADFCIERSF